MTVKETPKTPGRDPWRAHEEARRRQLRLNLGDFFSRPREGIEDHYGYAIALRVDPRGDLAKRSSGDVIRGAIHVFEVALGIQIVHGNA